MSTENNDNDEVKSTLVPSDRIASNLHPDLQHPQIAPFSAGKNEYHLVEIDKEGNEVPGSDFSVGEVNYNLTFANNPNFRVKKNI